MRKLTDTQELILETIRASWVDRGYAPTFEEIGRNAGLSSMSTVWHHLDSLEKKGLITRGHNSPRSVSLTKEGAKAIAVSDLGFAAMRNPAAFALSEMIRQIVREEIERQTAGKDKL